jgi:uncharacterized protein
MNNNIAILDKPKKISGLHLFKRKEKVLCIDPETSSWIILDESAHVLYNNCNGDKSIQALSTIFNINLPNLISWFRNLYNAGMISINENRKISSEKFTNLIDRYPTLGIIHTSNNCNLKCKYCYAHPDNAPKQDMSLNVMQKAIDEMLLLPRENLHISIEFHGGEPLMHFNTIRNAVLYGEKVSRIKGISILYQMQTNGTIINEEIINFLKDKNIKLRISIDGNKEIHDANRLFKNGEGSFSKVFNNIKLLQDNKVDFEVISVVSKTNVDSMQNVLDFFIEHKITNIRLIPMWIQGNADCSLAITPEHFSERYIELIRKIIYYNINNYIKISNINLKYLFETILSWERNFMCFRAPCGAGLDMIDFSVNGDVYPCEEMNERQELKIGNIFDTPLKEIIDNSELIKILKTRIPEKIDKCNHCTWKRFCNSGCANKVHLNYKTFFHESEFCAFFKKIYLEIIWILLEIPEARWAIFYT